jgi:predicted GIY-YIG superfamily endonuclease
MKIRGYWTREKCVEVVSKYKTKKDLYTNDQSAYVTITRNKWFDIIEHLEVSKNDIFKRVIYSYEFDDKHCYVGLTYNVDNRNRQHLFEDNGQVSKHIKNTGLTPKLFIKTDKVSIDEAIKLEEVILNEYKLNGWFILNKARTGSTGGFSKFNLESCVDNLKNIDNLKNFRIKHKSEYDYIVKHNLYYDNEIIRDLMDIKRIRKINIFIDKYKCKEESFKYKNRTQFQKYSKSAYNVAWRNNWLDEFFKSMK